MVINDRNENVSWPDKISVDCKAYSGVLYNQFACMMSILAMLQ